ncbi:hypothetical protein G6F59_017096 [Rhizopus arrhizus]|nr:hypothetical protein G6F59_017096 [Rhizopus arrhizus]
MPPPGGGFHRLGNHGGDRALGIQQRAERKIEAAPAGRQLQVERMQRTVPRGGSDNGAGNGRADVIGAGEPGRLTETQAHHLGLVGQHRSQRGDVGIPHLAREVQQHLVLEPGVEDRL